MPGDRHSYRDNNHAKTIAELAARHRLPALYGNYEAVESGGLMSYAVNVPAVFRHAAQIVDKIVKGAKPADLPMEQPTRFELRADRVIE